MTAPIGNDVGYAIIRDGVIISGGKPCARCGKPTLSSALKEPWGRSGEFEYLCSDHMPFRLEVIHHPPREA